MRIDRRALLAGAGSSAFLASGSPARAGIITPESFGARGDGQTNDTLAFARMAAFVTKRGGGEVVLRPVTYVIGLQRMGDLVYAFAPSPVMDFINCSLSLVIRGNGARLLCAPGLKYGTFDPITGQPTHHPMPYIQSGELAIPYRAMIRAQGCGGGLEISDLELDGNLSRLAIGGQYGDVGWQIPATGIHLVENSGPQRLVGIRSHDHALDGLLVDGLDAPTPISLFDRVICDGNGRQGCSVVGGRGFRFSDCKFARSGKGAIASPPGAGVDIEAEGGKRVRDLAFARCEFSDSSGAALVADSGDSEGAVFTDCRFFGTTNWAAWPNKPRFRFHRCTFVGPIVHAFGDSDPARATQFHECLFRDDPALSPTGEVYGGENPDRPIADLPANRNVLFNRCRFELTHRAALPWTTSLVTFADCFMSQRSKAPAYPRGTFVGRNIINGPVTLYSARIRGELIVNGKRLLTAG